MASEHDYFIGFIASGNLRYGVVRSRALRINMVHYIELERNVCAIGKNARDASIVFIAHDDSRYRFGYIKSSIVECANLTKLTTRIIYTNYCTVITQKQIKLFG